MKSHKSSLLSLIFILIGIGITFISISSLTEANNTIGDKFFYLKKQGFWILISFMAFFIASKINLKIIKKISFLFYLGSIIGLILVLIPGFSNETLGAKRWLNLGIFSFQPTELLKLSSIIYFSSLFSVETKRNFVNLVLYLIIPFILIILEPNLSTAILISAMIISLFYLAGGKIMPLFSLCLSLIALSFILVISSPYRLARLNTLLNPSNNTQSISYHSNQIILSLSSGGIFGKGFANSDQKYRFLPKISTDSILAIIGEETGFVGVSLVLITYLFLIFYLLKISSIIHDDLFSSLLVSGTACWIAYQCLINISAIANLIPLTGVPLPFISYGGSSLLTLMTAMGLVRNIEKKHSLLLYSNNETNLKKDYYHRHPSHSRSRTYSPTSARSKN
jgi:cell division protein FtsW